MRILPLAVAAALPLLLSSCIVPLVAAGAAAYGAISYHNNEATMDVPDELPAVHTAAVAALTELGFQPTAVTPPGPTDGEVSAGDAHVRLERYAGGTTRVRVRVGTFDTEDNERRARLVLESIKRRL